MHRATPANTLHRAYDSGGSRSCIDQVDDTHMMQEMAGAFLKGEARKALEAPQNYGFSSVVMAATKGADGLIEECAEGFISFLGGNRSFPVCTVMDDRRHRPMQLPQGASAQYGPNTQYGRALTFIKPTPQQDSQSSSPGGPSVVPHNGGGGSGGSQDYGLFMAVPHPQEYVSMRHINNKQQPRPQSQQGGQQSGGGGGGTTQATQPQQTQQQQYNHEKGDSINTEVRCTNARIEFRSGDNVVGYYDKQAGKWSFTGEVHLGVDSASHPVYGVNSGVGKTTETSGSGAVLVNAPKPGPPVSMDMQPLAIEEQLAQAEQRYTAAEQRITVLEQWISVMESRVTALGG